MRCPRPHRNSDSTRNRLMEQPMPESPRELTQSRQRRVRYGMTLILAALSASLAAQAPRSFDAASVKRNTTTGAGLPPVVAISGQRLSAPFVTLREAIRVAYGVYDNQVIGGPGWLD